MKKFLEKFKTLSKGKKIASTISVIVIIFFIIIAVTPNTDAISIIKNDNYNYCSHTTEEALKFYYGNNIKWKDNGEGKVTIDIDNNDIEYLWVVNYEELNDETISYSFDDLYIDGHLQDYDTAQSELSSIFDN